MRSWRSASVVAFLIVGVAAACVPAVAQPMDPFQEAPGPASEAAPPRTSRPPAPAVTRPPEHVVIHRVIQRVFVPEPTTRPRVAEPAPAPAVVAPAPAADGVRQFAAARGIPLPGDVQVRRTSAASSSASRLVGVWGGQWGGNGRYLILAVESVDANGTAVIVVAYSAPTAATGNQKPAHWARRSAQVRDNAVAWTAYDGSSHQKFTLVGDNQLFGEQVSGGGRQNSVYLTRLQ